MTKNKNTKKESVNTTQQVKKKVSNPTGKGGFAEHPENRNPGGWNKDNSFSYWMNFFKSLKKDEFLAYKNKHPDMTMAAFGAYARIAKMIDEIAEFREVANRTEGMPIQAVEHSGDATIIIKHAIPDIKDE